MISITSTCRPVTYVIAHIYLLVMTGYCSPPLEIGGLQMKGGGLHSYSKEHAWGEAAEDEELKPGGEEQETPLWA